MNVLLDLTMPEDLKQTASSDFAAPRWAVINSETCAATGLSYDEAVARLRELSNSMSGLCVVTNEAAHRLCGEANGSSKTNQAQEDLSQTAFSETL